MTKSKTAKVKKVCPMRRDLEKYIARLGSGKPLPKSVPKKFDDFTKHTMLCSECDRWLTKLLTRYGFHTLTGFLRFFTAS